MLHLLSHISTALCISNDAARSALEQSFVQRKYNKNELLTKAGQICRHLYFIEKGSVRGY
ncbi:MAG: Crp/Fnr family transcriptional regulator, partial [Sphingobacteriales bacterium]